MKMRAHSMISSRLRSHSDKRVYLENVIFPSDLFALMRNLFS